MDEVKLADPQYMPLPLPARHAQEKAGEVSKSGKVPDGFYTS
jgi:hypothetical protein